MILYLEALQLTLKHLRWNLYLTESATMPNIGSAANDFSEHYRNKYTEKQIWLSTPLYLSVLSIAGQHICSYSK